MGRHNSFDDEMEGQMSIFDLYEPPERMVAVSNIFARARKQMSLAEQKTFVLALSQLEWTKGPTEQSNIVKLNKKTLENVLGYKSNSTDISGNTWNAIKYLPQHSFIEITDDDKEFYTSGSVVSTITRRRNWDYIRVKFEEDYFPLFTGLGSKYITMWSMDIFKMTMKSGRSVQFYELLRQMSFDRYEVGNDVYTYGWGIKALKEMFDIPKDGKGSYTDKNGHFDRPKFEQRILDPICEDLAKCKMIQLVIQSNGKPYEKVKKGNRVQGYQFYWTLSQRPAVAEAHEVKAIADRVDKNPQVLKVAKDMLNGEKKPKKPKKNSFNNFEQREYDFEALEKAMLAKSMPDIYGEKEDDHD
mgnify:CR=1 FL=1|jgi:hypothetical protein